MCKSDEEVTGVAVLMHFNGMVVFEIFLNTTHTPIVDLSPFSHTDHSIKFTEQIIRWLMQTADHNCVLFFSIPLK